MRHTTVRMSLCAAAIAGALIVVPSAAASTTDSPTNLNFGSQQVGSTSAPQTVAVTVTCTTSISFPTDLCIVPGIFIPPPNLTGNAGDFPQTNTCGAGITNSTLSPLVCAFTVRFKPTNAGPRTATLVTGTELLGTAPAPVTLNGAGLSNPGSGGTGSTTGKKKCKKKPRSTAQTAKKRCKKK